MIPHQETIQKVDDQRHMIQTERELLFIPKAEVVHKVNHILIIIQKVTEENIIQNQWVDNHCLLYLQSTLAIRLRIRMSQVIVVVVAMFEAVFGRGSSLIKAFNR